MPEETETTTTVVPTAPVARTFSQAEVEALMAKEKDRAQRAGRDAFLATLGVASTGEAETLFKEAQAAKAAQMSDAEKAKAAADAEKSAAVAERSAASLELLAARSERELIKAGLPVEVDSADGKAKIDNPQLAYALRLLNVKPGDDAAAVKAAVDEVKAAFPTMFTAQTAAAPAGTSTTAQVRPPRGGNNGTTRDAKGNAQAAMEMLGIKGRTTTA